MASVRVVRRTDHEGLPWTATPRPEGDLNPPGEEVTAFKSADGRFMVGLWRRVPEVGPMTLDDYHEVALILEGDVEVTDEDGSVHRAGPGDLLITPRGTKATWHALTPIKKVWMTYSGD